MGGKDASVLKRSSVNQRVVMRVSYEAGRCPSTSRQRSLFRLTGHLWTVTIGRMMQWHPIFARLLRPAVEGYYDVETTFPVGDAPREADFVLLRRTGSAPPPFRGLWRHLTSWNILEFKGPTVSPRRGHIESLIELGLGIDRRLRARRTGQ